MLSLTACEETFNTLAQYILKEPLECTTAAKTVAHISAYFNHRWLETNALNLTTLSSLEGIREIRHGLFCHG